MKSPRGKYKGCSLEQLERMLSAHQALRPQAPGPISSMDAASYAAYTKELEPWAYTKRELEYEITMAIKGHIKPGTWRGQLVAA